MPPPSRPIIVVEDDRFLRLIQVILDPNTPPERMEAFRHFLAHDLPDFPGWLARVRVQLGRLYPAEVRLVENQDALGASLTGASAVVVEEFKIGAAEIAAAGGADGSLRAVQKYGAVTRSIDRAACKRANVRVLTLRRRANVATAEHALALLLALARRIARTANLIGPAQLGAAGFSPTRFDTTHTANGNWGRVGGLKTLYGLQLGIVGLGEIGREIALRAAAFEMKIVYTQRTRLEPDDERRFHAAYATLDELLAQSDCVSLNLPGGTGTRGIIGKRELGMIKPGALLVNVSQPQLVDRGALLEALAAGRLGGFGLDVPYDEPGDPEDPLIKFPNVIVTPHLGASPRLNSLDDFEELLVNLARTLGC